MSHVEPASYIKTSDGHIGVVTGGTVKFIDAEVQFEEFTLNLRFSKHSKRQYNTPNRKYCTLQMAEVVSGEWKSIWR